MLLDDKGPTTKHPTFNGPSSEKAASYFSEE